MMYKVPEKVVAAIETGGENIDSIALGYYLYIFSLLYSNIAKNNHQFDNHVDINKQSVSSVVDHFRSSGEKYYLYRDPYDMITVPEKHGYFGYLFRDRLSIVDIKRENPLYVVFEGIGIVMAAAVVISGGEYELGPLKVKLPPLGKGIEAIMSAFRK